MPVLFYLTWNMSIWIIYGYDAVTEQKFQRIINIYDLGVINDKRGFTVYF